ncbi:MAG: histidinol-phosphate transaminase, partial [Mucinivorans sp.]
ARDESSLKIGLFLDANESPWDTPYNRYPDPHQKEIKALLSEIKGVPTENIFLGNGSDEAIDLVYRVFCEPRVDNVVAISPSYGMYRVAAATNDVQYRAVRLNDNFELDAAALLAHVDEHTKAIFLCSPNNPSGNLLDEGQVLQILDTFDGVVVVDEAYIDFADSRSSITLIEKYPRLIVLQTLSKAWGMAGLRLGIAVAASEIISLFSRVKYPYNIGSATQRLVIEKLSQGIDQQVVEIKKQRAELASKIAQCATVRQVFPSDANFVLARVDDANALYDKLIAAGVIVRNRSSIEGCAQCLRITVGTAEQNEALLAILDNRAASASMRSAKIERTTRETEITCAVDLDQQTPSAIDTGLKFLDHMLDQIVHHAGISLTIKAVGDLQVDEHHTIEDVAIALGEALDKALGSKRGIERYGFALPMDEARALVLLDFGGRIDFEWDVPFTRDMVGDVPSEMFAHFFKSLAAAAHCNLHIAASGENNHHLIEGVFKAFARALRMAVRREPFAYDLPSSKGIL